MTRITHSDTLCILFAGGLSQVALDDDESLGSLTVEDPGPRFIDVLVMGVTVLDDEGPGHGSSGAWAVAVGNG